MLVFNTNHECRVTLMEVTGTEFPKNISELATEIEAFMVAEGATTSRDGQKATRKILWNFILI